MKRNNKQKFTRLFSILIVTLALMLTGMAQNTLTVVERSKALAVFGKVIWRNQPEPITIDGIDQTSRLITQTDTNTIRLHFNVTGTFLPGTWALRILNTANNVVWSYQSEIGDKTQFWSTEIVGNQAKVEVLSTRRENKITVLVDAVAVTTASSIPQSTTPPRDQMIEINNEIVQRRDWGKSVARLRFIGDDGKLYFCSGFLISANLLMTNEHCPDSENEWRSTLVDFDFDVPNTRPRPENVSQFKDFVLSHRPLDFSIFRLKFTPPGRVPLVLDTSVPSPNKDLLLIQHPGGKSKRISVIDCKAVAPPQGLSPRSASDFFHLCDTEGGSSGSGVIDPATGKVVGLHHLGWDTEQMPLPPDSHQLNQAVLMRDIINFIKTNRPDIAAEIGIQ